MKERPILFSTEMVRAILDNRKTQTRRVVKFTPDLGEQDAWCHKIGTESFNKIVGDYRRYCPYGQPGDVLWVRETFYKAPCESCDYGDDWEPCTCTDLPYYRASWNPKLPVYFKWKPSIFMPKWACRIKILITDVSVERLHDISGVDSMAEGVEDCDIKGHDDCFYGASLQGYKCSFEQLWNSINGKTYSWESNPYVWVVKFEVQSEL